jgi:hypothetical protein
VRILKINARSVKNDWSSNANSNSTEIHREVHMDYTVLTMYTVDFRSSRYLECRFENVKPCRIPANSAGRLPLNQSAEPLISCGVPRSACRAARTRS